MFIFFPNDVPEIAVSNHFINIFICVLQNKEISLEQLAHKKHIMEVIHDRIKIFGWSILLGDTASHASS